MNIIRNINFAKLFFATLISNLGTGIFNFIIGWYILEVTKSPLQMGTFISIPYIIHIFFSPFFGSICDQINRKKIVVYTDLINAIMMIIILMFLIGDFSLLIKVSMFYIVNIIICITDSLANIATFTLKKECCPNDQIQKGNTLFGIQSNFATITGSLISGFLYYYVGLIWCVIINFFSYVIAIILESSIKVTSSILTEKLTVQNTLNNIKEGVRYVKKRSDIIEIFIIAIIFNSTLNPLTQVIQVCIINQRDIPVTKFSLIKSFLTIGSAFCSLYLLKKDDKLSLTTFRKFFKYYGLVYCLFLINYELLVFNIIPKDTYVIIGSIIFFCIGIIVALFNIPFNNYIHLSVESNMIGRVYSLFSVAAHLFTPIALISTSFLIKYNINLVMIISLLIICYELLKKESK